MDVTPLEYRPRAHLNPAAQMQYRLCNTMRFTCDLYRNDSLTESVYLHFDKPDNDKTDYASDVDHVNNNCCNQEIIYHLNICQYWY